MKCPAHERALLAQPLTHDQQSCLTKKQYATQAEAQAKVLECEEARGKPLRCYQCPVGKHWHLTSTFPRRFYDPLCGVCLKPFPGIGRDEWCCQSCSAKAA